MRTGERRRRLPSWAIGLILVVVFLVASVYAYTKTVPWANPYTVQAVFPSAANIRPSSPVRIAGVNVGEVTSIEHIQPEDADELTAQAATSDDAAPSIVPSTATVVTMELDESALPLKTDATMKLRPRLFLEGNLFVDLEPGTPNAEEAEDGYVFPVGQTSIAVQIDQIFTTLQADVRSDLQTLLDELGKAFENGGAEGFREIYETSPGAFRYTAEVNEAFLGTEEHDLSELIVNLNSTVAALNQGSEIQDLVTNLDTVLGSFAAESDALEQAIVELPRVLEVGRPALASLNSSFPSLRAFSREALPGVRSTPATLDAATPLLAQIGELVSEDELRGLVSDLRPTLPALAKLSKETIPFLREGRKLASCFNEVVIPFGYDKVEDPETPATGQVYEELGFGLSGISGESRSGDANGPYIRTLAGGGPNTVIFPGAFQNGSDPAEDAVGVTSAPLVGAIPDIEDSVKTPFRPDVRCETQDQPNLEASSLNLDEFQPDLNSSPSPLQPVAPTDGLTDAVESANSEYDSINKLFEAGRLAKGQNLRDDVLDDVNEELAKAYDMEYLIDFLDQEPTP
ncbi:MAG: MlaD family protein [Actinomycetota bacterium]|nr:MlaD family protein [Actinomycetota bacterium]